MSIFNLQELLFYWGPNQDVIIDFLANFEDEHTAISNRLENSLAKLDTTESFKALHRLKGFLLNLRWSQLDEKVLEFELSLSAKDFDLSIKLLLDIHRMSEVVVQAIKSHELKQ